MNAAFNPSWLFAVSEFGFEQTESSRPEDLAKYAQGFDVPIPDDIIIIYRHFPPFYLALRKKLLSSLLGLKIFVTDQCPELFRRVSLLRSGALLFWLQRTRSCFGKPLAIRVMVNLALFPGDVFLPSSSFHL
jgi:hypothetical protein